ncbi:hypothetical protein B0H34DRAFT_344402 [Crassisporium funariophilum]|nr:hypothetical protein B0H34DRAFT_344402 [Crassisporium funariophilum]
MYSLYFVALYLLSLSVGHAVAEKHVISFDNKCGYGSPRLIQKGNILSTGDAFTSNGPFSSGIAYLQTGNCLLNGEGCTLVEMTLVNPSCPGCGSSTDISLIPPYQGGCNGQGATCSSPNCNTAFFVPDDNHVQVQCQENDVNLLITFCGGGDDGAAVSHSKPAPVPSITLAVAPPPSIIATSSKVPASIPSASSNVPQCARKRSRRRRSQPSTESQGYGDISPACRGPISITISR